MYNYVYTCTCSTFIYMITDYTNVQSYTDTITYYKLDYNNYNIFPFVNIVPPSFAPVPSDSLAIENSLHTLTCTVNGDPIPSIQWTRGSLVYPMGSLLTFSTVNRTHTGFYTCTANNVAGQIMATIYLDVYCKLLT